MNDPRLGSVPAGRLIGIAEIAVLLNVKRETVDNWRVRDRKGRVEALPMPQPVLPYEGMETNTPLWDKNEIMAWANATGRVRIVRRPVPRNPDSVEEV